ncbi:HAD hydrolase-like protein, partial [Salmonella sp. s51228]|uniref:HAD hydrolase-like protein n=1 Tax=Salmonella sp. s51228 TaxID=3159652 RepID=UPI00397FD161
MFDLDGLLLNTEPIYTEVTQSIIGRFGKVYTWDVKSKVIGKIPAEATRTLLEGLGLTEQLTVEEFLNESEQKICKLFPNCPLMPGAEKLIRHFHSL